jgi:hypothetical protein
VKYKFRNKLKTENVNYINPVDACRLWMLHPTTSLIIKEKYEKHTQPFLNNLSDAIVEMENEMRLYDYEFSDQYTGTEWLRSIERVFDESIQPNMINDDLSMLFKMFYAYFLILIRCHSAFYIV